MSSRQIKWLKQQLYEGKNQNKEIPIEDDSPVAFEEKKFDFSALADEEYSDSQMEEEAIVIEAPPPPPPSAPKNKTNKKKKNQVDENDEYEALAIELAKKKTENKSKSAKKKEQESEGLNFQMSQLNIAAELKKILGTTSYDEYLKVPKAAASIRFMSRIKSYPKPFPMFFDFQSIGNDEYVVKFTETGESQYSIFSALQRINDIQGIIELLPQMPFCPLVLPIICQQKLFSRDFDRATDMAMKGLYVLQQSLPSNFVPIKSKLLPSPARNEFLSLIAFLARFAYRRCCFESSTALWKFGISLTNDDPLNFLLLAAVPAAYAKDETYIDLMLNSDIKWRGIPLKYIPDWGLAKAIFSLPDDILPLSNEIAKWSFAFKDLGAECNFDVPPLLASIGEAFRRRTKKLFEGKDDVLQTAAMLSADCDMADEQAIAISYWCEVDTTGVDVADFVEEMVLPTG